MNDPSWVRNCELLTKALLSLDRSTSTIRRSTNKVYNLKDITKEREKVKSVTSSTNSKEVQEVQDTLKLLEKFIRLNPPQLSSQGAKLTTDAQVALQNYQQACDLFYKKCISVEEKFRDQPAGSGVASGGRRNRGDGDVHVDIGSEDDDADEGEGLLGNAGKSGRLQNQAQLHSQRDDFERTLHEEIMAERNREAKEIAENVKDIKEIFQHINELVGEQGVTLDEVEQNVGRANVATRNGVNHLRQAQQHQDDSRRNKMCLIFIMVIVFLVVIGLLFS